MSQPDPATSAAYVCPHCGQPAPAADSPTGIMRCAHCTGEFIIEAGAPPSPAEPRADTVEFDQLRIRQTVVLRRGLYRGRSYAVIASIACAAAGAQCIYLAWRHVRAAGWETRPIVYAMLAVLAAVGTVWFARRARSLSREAQRTALPEPASRPDFSTLSDGSQRTRNLESVE